MSTRNRNILLNYNCFFLTTSFKDWIKLLLHDSYYDLILRSLEYCLNKYDANLVAYVLMPDHIHLIIFYNNKTEVSGLMRDFKKYTSVKIRKKLEEDKRVDIIEKLVYVKGGQKYKVWQDRFDAQLIISKSVLLTKINYIHNNPVKRGLVSNSVEWEYSSAEYYLGRVNEETMNILLRHANEIA